MSARFYRCAVERVYGLRVSRRECDVDAGRGRTAREDPEVVCSLGTVYEPKGGSSFVGVNRFETQRGNRRFVEPAARSEVAHPDGDVVYDDLADYVVLANR